MLLNSSQRMSLNLQSTLSVMLDMTMLTPNVVQIQLLLTPWTGRRQVNCGFSATKSSASFDKTSSLVHKCTYITLRETATTYFIGCCESH